MRLRLLASSVSSSKAPTSPSVSTVTRSTWRRVLVVAATACRNPSAATGSKECVDILPLWFIVLTDNTGRRCDQLQSYQRRSLSTHPGHPWRGEEGAKGSGGAFYSHILSSSSVFTVPLYICNFGGPTASRIHAHVVGTPLPILSVSPATVVDGSRLTNCAPANSKVGCIPYLTIVIYVLWTGCGCGCKA